MSQEWVSKSMEKAAEAFPIAPKSLVQKLKEHIETRFCDETLSPKETAKVAQALIAELNSADKNEKNAD